MKISQDPEEQYEQAREAAFRMLDSQARTRADLELRLIRRGYDGDVIVRVLDRLTEIGYIDDRAYATMWAAARHTSRGLARSAIKRELQSKGVDVELVDEALEAISDDDEQARAAAIAEIQAQKLQHMEPQAAIRRIVGVLARRGYSGGLAYTAARTAVNAAHSTDIPDQY